MALKELTKELCVQKVTIGFIEAEDGMFSSYRLRSWEINMLVNRKLQLDERNLLRKSWRLWITIYSIKYSKENAIF